MVIEKLKQAVFLDRDGVIIESNVFEGKPKSIYKSSEIKIIRGVTEAIIELTNAGFEIVVITNQPDISRGYTTFKEIKSIHRKLSEKLKIKHFYVCPHLETDNCFCRKPQPGMILDAAKDLKIDLQKSYLVGDRWKDIAAGQKVGCTSFFIDYNYMEATPNPPFAAVTSLAEATKRILSDGIDKRIQIWK